MTPINIPGPDASDKDWRVFLEHQLAGAVGLLRSKDDTEEACIRRLDAKYLAHEDAQRKKFDDLERAMGESHRRYEFLRQHQVQIWSLGIAASDENLDKALDEQIEQELRGSAIATSP